VSTRTMPGITVITQWDVKRHSEIVDAIESGDAAQASVAVREHIAGAATVLVDGAA
jgi:DNA-binding FadR family transcriptional regulator